MSYIQGKQRKQYVRDSSVIEKRQSSLHSEATLILLLGIGPDGAFQQIRNKIYTRWTYRWRRRQQSYMLRKDVDPRPAIGYSGTETLV
jgi:hypothetical protein